MTMAKTETIKTGTRTTATAKSALAAYLLLGIAFGIVLTKSEVLSWFRIQEMFRFQSFRMYGIIGTAIATAAVSLVIIKRFHQRALSGDAISIPPKKIGSGVRYAVGGVIFGIGWALTGALPRATFRVDRQWCFRHVGSGGQRVGWDVDLWCSAASAAALNGRVSAMSGANRAIVKRKHFFT